jgi:hypothetical protein
METDVIGKINEKKLAYNNTLLPLNHMLPIPGSEHYRIKTAISFLMIITICM